MINVADQLDRQDTNGYAGYDRICRIRLDMQDTIGYAGYDRICRIRLDMQDTIGYVICRIHL